MIGDKIFLCFVFLLIVPFISAELNLGFDSQDDLTVTLNKPDIELNYSLVPTVNSSDFWDALDTPADILGSWINNNLGWITSWLIPDTSTDWLYNDSTTIYFNSTKLSTTYYDATYAYAIVGTIDAGTLANTQHSDGNYDGITFDFSEEAGSPGLDLRINFTDITEFNGGVMRYRTDDLAGNYPIIQLWNFVDNGWEDYPPVGESIPYATINQDVYDYTEHVSNGNVSMRIYKASNGNTNNHYYIDWISIYKGYGTPAPEETDPYSWHRDTTGEYGNFTTSGYVNGTHIGDGSQLTGLDFAQYQFLNNNFNGSGNFTTSGDGLFNYLGSLINRIKILFVQDIYINGTLQVNSGLIEIKNNPPSGDCPANMSFINKIGGFCIDQYEASMPSASSTQMGDSADVANRNAVTLTAVSQPGVVPWVGISANSARAVCLNAGKHLCTSEEWLAAANINGEVYNLPTGAATATRIPASSSGDSDACVTYEAADCDGMSMNSSYVIGTGGDACNTGNKTSCVSSEGVYDMTGNVYEWTNETVGYTKPCEPVGTNGWCYWNGTNFINTTNTATAVYGNDYVYFLANTVSGYAVRRGCYWGSGAYAGPFCGYLSYGPTNTGNSIGFRCCSS